VRAEVGTTARATVHRALTPGASSAAGARALWLRLRHAHHPFGDAVCFLIVHVSGRIYRELCLDVYRQPGMHRYLTEVRRAASFFVGIKVGFKIIKFRLQWRLQGLIFNRAPQVQDWI
jgi:hypothetical protein